MKQRVLGTDLSVSAVGLGCMGFSHAYGAPTGKEEAVRVIGSACDMGYTFFDTAEVYGTEENPHDNEILVGEALRPYRNHVQIASKFGIRFDRTSSQVNHPLIPDSRPEVIRASVEGSLRRLQTDHIDLYFQHRMAREKEATPAQISMAWMLCKKPWIVPIPGTRKQERLRENAGAARVELNQKEVEALDKALDGMEMSAVFGGSKVRGR